MIWNSNYSRYSATLCRAKKSLKKNPQFVFLVIVIVIVFVYDILIRINDSNTILPAHSFVNLKALALSALSWD